MNDNSENVNRFDFPIFAIEWIETQLITFEINPSKYPKRKTTQTSTANKQTETVETHKLSSSQILQNNPNDRRNVLSNEENEYNILFIWCALIIKYTQTL